MTHMLLEQAMVLKKKENSGLVVQWLLSSKTS